MSVRQLTVTLGTALLLLCSATLWLQHTNGNLQGDNNVELRVRVTRSQHSFIGKPIDSDNHYIAGLGFDNGEFRTTAKEPITPPGSLPSDPYAHYIYHEELRFNELNDDPTLAVGKGRRTIVVGDIHGNLKGFNGFLKKIKHDSKRDVLILVGDLVAKGPMSLQVIDRARELKAKCVRGNHDDKVIRWKGFLNSLSLQELDALDSRDDDLDDDDDDDLDDDDDDDDEEEEEEEEEVGQRKNRIPSDLDKNSEHYKIARAMSKSQYEYLRNCPLILSLPRSRSVHNIPIHVVHAGIDPRHDILKQKPWVLINVRNLLNDGTPSRKKKDGEGWAKKFNDMHDRKSSIKQDFMVVYGHDAGRALNVKTWSIGIDSGCVYGRELTGYVVETGEIISVPCPKM